MLHEYRPYGPWPHCSVAQCPGPPLAVFEELLLFKSDDCDDEENRSPRIILK